MEYILRSTRHKTVISRTNNSSDILDLYYARKQKFPDAKFEIVNALGEVLNVEDLAGGRVSGHDTDVRETVSTDTDSEVSEYFGYKTESSSDSTD